MPGSRRLTLFLFSEPQSENTLRELSYQAGPLAKHARPSFSLSSAAAAAGLARPFRPSCQGMNLIPFPFMKHYLCEESSLIGSLPC